MKVDREDLSAKINLLMSKMDEQIAVLDSIRESFLGKEPSDLMWAYEDIQHAWLIYQLAVQRVHKALSK